MNYREGFIKSVIQEFPDKLKVGDEIVVDFGDDYSHASASEGSLKFPNLDKLRTEVIDYIEFQESIDEEDIDGDDDDYAITTDGGEINNPFPTYYVNKNDMVLKVKRIW